jgi:hypothetical protein
VLQGEEPNAAVIVHVTMAAAAFQIQPIDDLDEDASRLES